MNTFIPNRRMETIALSYPIIYILRQNLLEMTKARRMRWARHVVRMGMRKSYNMFVQNPEEIRLLRNLDVEGRIILKFMLENKYLERVDWINLAQDIHRCQAFVNTVVKLRHSLKARFLDYLSLLHVPASQE
jgi:hypothetical protein